MHDTLSIRLATSSDLSEVARLYRELDDAHQALDVELRTRGNRQRRAHLKATLDEGRACLVVATLGNSLIGFAIAAFARNRPDVVVEALAVDEPHRRKGVGGALMKRVEHWARQRSARYVQLDVYEFNPEARAFYESLGYLTTRRTMQKDPSFDVLSLFSATLRPR